jgi:hypothetical protein
MDNQIANGGIGLEGDERLALRLATTSERQEYRSERVFAVRHATGSPAESDTWGDHQGAVQTVKAGWNKADWAIGFGRLQRRLKGVCVVSAAVAFDTLLPGIDLTGCLHGGRAGGFGSIALCCGHQRPQAEGKGGVPNKASTGQRRSFRIHGVLV